MNLRKMIAIFLVLALLLPLAGCNIASEGKVTVYLVTSESKINAEGVEYARTEYEYDANGNITCQSSFSNGEKQSYEEYVYDEHGNQCSYIKYYVHDGKTIKDHRWTKVGEYDDLGRIIKETCTQYDAPAGTWLYTYDEKGQLVSRYGYTTNNQLHYANEYEYDTNGRVTKHTIYYSADKQRLWGYRYEYDSNGLLINEIKFEQDKDTSRTEYTYDKNGNKLSATLHKNENSSRLSDTWEYDRKGNLLVHTVYNSEGKESHRYEYAYNLSGDMTEYHYYQKGESFRNYFYQRDMNGCIKTTRYGENVFKYQYIKILVTPEQAAKLQEWATDEGVHIHIKN